MGNRVMLLTVENNIGAYGGEKNEGELGKGET
jgi:hypothetical protein